MASGVDVIVSSALSPGLRTVAARVLVSSSPRSASVPRQIELAIRAMLDSQSGSVA